MKFLKVVFAALALVCVSAPGVADAPTTEQADAAAVVAQASGENRAATLEDIKQNRAAIDAQGRELRAAIDAQGRELRAAIDRLSDRVEANLKWTIAAILAVLGLPHIVAAFRQWRNGGTRASS